MRSGAKIKRLFTDFLDDMVARLEFVVIKLSVYSVDPNALKLQEICNSILFKVCAITFIGMVELKFDLSW